MPTTSILSASLRLCGLVLILCLTLTAQIKDFTRWVDPFIGTGGHGHTFPGAVMPFGMVQLSPDTRTDNWDGSSGYHYSDDIIYGFSHTHLSGTGIPDGCDILFMPTVGEPQFFAKEGDSSINGDASKFSHANEKSEPGYYSVKLDDESITAEMTTTKRVGFHRYTFPISADAHIKINLSWRDKVLSKSINMVANRKDRIEGFRESSSWAKDQKIYFVAEFSSPFEHLMYPRLEEAAAKFGHLTRPLLVKVAISFVSIEGARKNLEAELPGWDFDKVRADAKAAWNKELSKIEVSGGTDAQTTTFYTALYHTMIHPSIFNDVDGNYRGLDGKTYNIADDAAVPLDVRRSSASPKGLIIPGGLPPPIKQRRSRKTSSEQQRKSGAPHIDGQSQNLGILPDQLPLLAWGYLFPGASAADHRSKTAWSILLILLSECTSRAGGCHVWELWGNETDR